MFIYFIECKIYKENPVNFLNAENSQVMRGTHGNLYKKNNVEEKDSNKQGGLILLSFPGMFGASPEIEDYIHKETFIERSFGKVEQM